MEIVINSQREVDHLDGLGDDLGATTEAGEEVADVAIILFDGEGQILAGEQLVLGDQPMEPFPIIGEEALALDPDLVEEFPKGFVVTATTHPGEGAAGDGIIGSPNPKLFRLFFRKCHISSHVMITVPAGTDGSGSRYAASRTQLSTVTSLRPRMRAMAQKLMLPIAYSIKASAFISGGLPRGGVIVKLQPHASQR